MRHARRISSAAAFDRQRSHRPYLFVGDAQALTAGRQDLVVREATRIASTRSAAASSTCSQLSNTSNRTPSLQCGGDRLRHLLPGCWVMPRTAATASGTAAGSATAASSKTHTPSGIHRTAAQRPRVPVAFSDSSDTGQCDQSTRAQQSSAMSADLLVAADQLDARAKIPWCRIERPQRRKVRP